MDSCLCDACIRYVDRKANCPSYKPPGGRREKNKYSGTQAMCCVNGCPQSAVHSLRKKWYFKIRKSVAQKVSRLKADCNVCCPIISYQTITFL